MNNAVAVGLRGLRARLRAPPGPRIGPSHPAGAWRGLGLAARPSAAPGGGWRPWAGPWAGAAAGSGGARGSGVVRGGCSGPARGFITVANRRRGWLPREMDDKAVLWGLVGANALVFTAWQVASPLTMQKHFTTSMHNLRNLRVWTTVTAAFSHRDFGHFATNMLGLYFYGQEIGRVLGGRRLLALYLVAGTVGSLAHVAYYETQQVGWRRGLYYSPPGLGASGAVNAIVILNCLLYPSRTIYLNFLLPVPAALLGVLFVLRDFSGLQNVGSGTGHAAHLGGAATGAVYWFLLKRFGL